MWKLDSYEVSISTGAAAFTIFDRVRPVDESRTLPRELLAQVVCVTFRTSGDNELAGCIFFNPCGNGRRYTLPIYWICTLGEDDMELKRKIVSALFARFDLSTIEVKSSRQEAPFWAQMGFVPSEASVAAIAK
jgi:hypothetical protein